MIEEGIIVKIYGDVVDIRVGRHENCTACGACASAQNAVVVAANTLNAKVGDRVKFELPESNMLFGAFMVFVFPLLSAALGAVFSFYCFGEYVIQAAILFFLISLLFVKMYDTKKGKDIESKARILEVI